MADTKPRPKKKRSSVKDNNPLEKTMRPSRRQQGDDKVKPRQTTLLLFPDQTKWLEEVCVGALKGGGNKMRKAFVIRALIDVAKNKGLDLQGAKNEKEVYEMVEELFK